MPYQRVQLQKSTVNHAVKRATCPKVPAETSFTVY